MPKVSDTRSRVRKTKSNQPHPLQVRVTDEVRGALSRVAQQEGRSLAKEIERRLEASLCVPVAAAPDALVYGWSNPQAAEALGIALALVTGQLSDAVGLGTIEGQNRKGFLNCLKGAFVQLLDGLGADTKPLPDTEKGLVDFIARGFITNFDRIEPDPSAYGQRSDLAVLAQLKKNWAPGGQASGTSEEK